MPFYPHHGHHHHLAAGAGASFAFPPGSPFHNPSPRTPMSPSEMFGSPGMMGFGFGSPMTPGTSVPASPSAQTPSAPRQREQIFEDYISADEVARGIKDGTIVTGILEIGSIASKSAVVVATVNGMEKRLTVEGDHINRAFDGDEVAVRFLTVSEALNSAAKKAKDDADRGRDTGDLSARIRRQIDYYFGDENWPKDAFLQEEAAKNGGWVPLSVVLSFRKMRKICNNAVTVAAALMSSTVVAVSDDGLSVRRMETVHHSPRKRSRATMEEDDKDLDAQDATAVMATAEYDPLAAVEAKMEPKVEPNVESAPYDPMAAVEPNVTKVEPNVEAAPYDPMADVEPNVTKVEPNVEAAPYDPMTADADGDVAVPMDAGGVDKAGSGEVEEAATAEVSEGAVESKDYDPTVDYTANAAPKRRIAYDPEEEPATKRIRTEEPHSVPAEDEKFVGNQGKVVAIVKANHRTSVSGYVRDLFRASDRYMMFVPLDKKMHKLLVQLDEGAPLDAKKVQVMVPPNLAGSLIGRGGVVLSAIKDESGASISLSPKDDSGRMRVCTVMGDEEAVDRAVQLVRENLAEKGHENVQVIVVKEAGVKEKEPEATEEKKADEKEEEGKTKESALPTIKTSTYGRDEIKKRFFVAEIGEWDVRSKLPPGRLVRDLGEHGTREGETNAMLFDREVDFEEFPDEILDALPKVDDIDKLVTEDLANRRDLRDWRVFSIDPDGAKDLDDALSIHVLENGNYLVGVHIADVTHFVKPGTALDDVAFSRATSVYLCDRVVPMLPRALSNGLCSLTTGEDRLAYSALVELDKDTCEEVKAEFCHTVIHTCGQLTYEQAQDMLDGKTDHGQPLMAQDCLLLAKVAMARRKKRFDNGAINFDIPALEFSLGDDKMPKDFHFHAHHTSNEVVEEFMLLANKVVAETIVKAYPKLGFLRAQTDPERKRAEELQEAWSSLGLGNVKTTTSLELQESLAKVGSLCTPEVRRVLNLTALFIMARAEYLCTADVEEKDWKHYALCLPVYTHFTSPIRRYADVIVHRLLNAVLEEKALSDPKERQAVLGYEMLEPVAAQVNKKARNADMCGQKSDALFLCFLLRGKPVNVPANVVRLEEDAIHLLIPKWNITWMIRVRDLKPKTSDFDSRVLTVIDAHLYIPPAEKELEALEAGDAPKAPAHVKREDILREQFKREQKEMKKALKKRKKLEKLAAEGNEEAKAELVALDSGDAAAVVPIVESAGESVATGGDASAAQGAGGGDSVTEMDVSKDVSKTAYTQDAPLDTGAKPAVFGDEVEIDLLDLVDGVDEDGNSFRVKTLKLKVLDSVVVHVRVKDGAVPMQLQVEIIDT